MLALCAESALWLANLTADSRVVEVPPEFVGTDLRVLDTAWLGGAADRSLPGAFDQAPLHPAPGQMMLDAYAVAVLTKQHEGGRYAT